MGLLTSLFGGKTTESVKVDVPTTLQNTLNQSQTQAQSAFSQPFQPYTAQRIADFSGDELAGFDAVRQFANPTGASAQLEQQALQRFLGAPDQQALQGFMNPYTEGVLDRTNKRLTDQFDRQINKIRNTAATQGAYGGSRYAVQESEALENFMDTIADTNYRGLADSFNQGMDRYYNTAAQGYGMGLQSQGFDLDQANALLGIGAAQRQLEQSGLDFNYQEFMRGINQPKEDALGLAQIGALYPTDLVNRTSITKKPPGILNAILGTAATIGGAFAGSDRKMKTDITKLGKDKETGLDMYAYRYKGDPKSYPKVVGPMAQDVEKKNPDMVKEFAGKKAIKMQDGGTPPSKDPMWLDIVKRLAERDSAQAGKEKPSFFDNNDDGMMPMEDYFKGGQALNSIFSKVFAEGGYVQDDTKRAPIDDIIALLENPKSGFKNSLLRKETRDKLSTGFRKMFGMNEDPDKSFYGTPPHALDPKSGKGRYDVPELLQHPGRTFEKQKPAGNKAVPSLSEAMGLGSKDTTRIKYEKPFAETLGLPLEIPEPPSTPTKDPADTRNWMDRWIDNPLTQMGLTFLAGMDNDTGRTAGMLLSDRKGELAEQTRQRELAEQRKMQQDQFNAGYGLDKAQLAETIRANNLRHQKDMMEIEVQRANVKTQREANEVYKLQTSLNEIMKEQNDLITKMQDPSITGADPTLLMNRYQQLERERQLLRDKFNTGLGLQSVAGRYDPKTGTIVRN